MAIRTLLIGPRGYGGEGVYMDTLQRHPPPGVIYDVSDDFHQSAAGARCVLPVEVLLNRVIRPRTIPDIGFRALRLGQRYDLVHSHAHPLWLRRRRGTPLVMSEGSSAAVYLADYLGWDDLRIADTFGRSRRLYRLLGINDRLLALDGATSVYVFSNWARDLNIRWGADPGKLQVIYPGFELQREISRIGRETFTFLFVGTDFERKGGHDVVEAFAAFCRDLPHTRLIIVGSDLDRPNPDRLVHSWVSDERRERIVHQLRVLERSGRIVWLRRITRELLHAEVFPKADAFVMPTNAEGFGFTNVEAMSFGLPVITSTVGPAAEIVRDGVTGRLVAPRNVPDLAEAMHAFASSPQLAAAMGSAGRSHFEHRFTLGHFRQALGAFYASAVQAA